MPPPEQPPAASGPRGIYADLVPHLSASRLAPYLSATSGNQRQAISLYQWNIEVSGAIYQALHVLEVVLRNAIDRQLRKWNAEQANPATGRPHAAEWLIDPSALLTRILRDDLGKAAFRAEAATRALGRDLGHDDILAQLTFGSWRYMLPNRGAPKQALWREALHQAFPRLARPETRLVADIDGLHRLRNRVAHLEPILDSGRIRGHYLAIRQVLRDIDHRAEEWFVSQQRITPCLRDRPAS